MTTSGSSIGRTISNGMDPIDSFCAELRNRKRTTASMLPWNLTLCFAGNTLPAHSPDCENQREELLRLPFLPFSGANGADLQRPQSAQEPSSGGWPSSFPGNILVSWLCRFARKIVLTSRVPATAALRYCLAEG